MLRPRESARCGQLEDAAPRTKDAEGAAQPFAGAERLANVQALPRPDPDDLARSLEALRPKLHRYCARMTGSVIDGEDAVQETLLKALKTPPDLQNLEAWVLRIARNAATDLLRRRARAERQLMLEDPETPSKPDAQLDRRQALEASVGTFLKLPAAQRSAVILMDVLGYSLRDIEAITGGSVPAIKASLHRGRARLRQLCLEPEAAAPVVMDPNELELLRTYVEHFNARDFDAVRDLLADEVRLDLVTRARMQGKTEVATYFHNYSGTSDWHFSVGFVDGHPALLVHDRRTKSPHPAYAVLLRWERGKLTHIRDFRYARYVLDGATVHPSPHR